MRKIQEQFDSEKSGNFVLSSGEYEGPLRIDRPCVVDGKTSTLWASRGPVLLIDAPNVVVRNLCVEVTGSSDTAQAQTAIQTTHSDTQLERVEVAGGVVGLPGEAAFWALPSALVLGTFAANAENTFNVAIEAAAAAELVNEISDIEISTRRLSPGINNITIQTIGMRDQMILYGALLVKTAVTRRIYVTGRAEKGAPVQRIAGRPIDGRANGDSLQRKPPNEVIAPRVANGDATYLQRGQRIPIVDSSDSVLKVAYEHSATKQALDIDGYAFMLEKTGKVACDEDFLFFGNKESKDRAIRLGSAAGMPIFFAEIGKLNPATDKIVFCYSIYGDEPTVNFSLVDSPIVRIFSGAEEICRCKLEDLRLEKAAVAIELYRHKDAWKINFVGVGYPKGIRRLCESFGVNIEQQILPQTADRERQRSN